MILKYCQVLEILEMVIETAVRNSNLQKEIEKTITTDIFPKQIFIITVLHPLSPTKHPPPKKKNLGHWSFKL